MYLVVTVVFLPLFLVNSLAENVIEVDIDKFKVWGPGLEPVKLVFPARYFFVEAYDVHGNK